MVDLNKYGYTQEKFIQNMYQQVFGVVEFQIPSNAEKLILEDLTEKQCMMLRLRYGCSLERKKVAELMDVSVSRIGTMENFVIQKLKIPQKKFALAGKEGPQKQELQKAVLEKRPLHFPLYYLGLSIRTENALKRYFNRTRPVKTDLIEIEELVQFMKTHDLYEISGIAKSGANEIEIKLKELFQNCQEQGDAFGEEFHRKDGLKYIQKVSAELRDILSEFSEIEVSEETYKEWIPVLNELRKLSNALFITLEQKRMET